MKCPVLQAPGIFFVSMIDTVEVRGRATFEPDPDKAFVTRVRAHYGAQGPPTDGPDDHRWIVTIEPDRVNVTGGR